MIEIDDAGSGSLVGGTGIGVMRVETGEYIFKIIPLVFFQHPYFSEKKYQEYVIKIIKLSFRRFGVSKTEPVSICRGYIFDALRKWLEQEGYNWSSTKIEGMLQYRVEESFNDYVIRLGLPRNFIQHARYAFGFHRLLKWVFADYENRAKLCKSGWKSWNKWCQVPCTMVSTHALKETYCLKCGKYIKKDEPVITIEYTTNRYWAIPLHTGCCPTRLPENYPQELQRL